MLDMHSRDIDATATSQGFLFSDACLIREPEAQRFQWWYDVEQREYLLDKPEETNGDTFTSMTLRGNNWLYLLPSRYTQGLDDRTQVDSYLQEFLDSHRNIGERVSNIIWLQPVIFSPQLSIELTDDVSNPAAVVADIYTVLENALSPGSQRASTAALRAQGWSDEDIFEGPWLLHGWLPELAAPLISDRAMTLSLAPIMNQLLSIRGVAAVNNLSADNLPEHITALTDESWSWQVDSGYFPQLWGADPLTLLCSADSPLTLIAKGGISVALSKQDIVDALPAEPVIQNEEITLTAGDVRDLNSYKPVTSRLPACYHTQEYPADDATRRLYQFILPFDQMLADGCAELSSVPALLSFTGRSNQIRGIRTPYDSNTTEQQVHEDYDDGLMQTEQNEVSIFSDSGAPNMANFSRELDFMHYLLGYFGTNRAARPMTLDMKDFLSTQRGFLAQQPSLGYDRVNMGSDAISALQKRLAARIGLGGECFSNNPDLSKLPFYLVEHRQLLPSNKKILITEFNRLTLENQPPIYFFTTPREGFNYEITGGSSSYTVETPIKISGTDDDGTEKSFIFTATTIYAPALTDINHHDCEIDFKKQDEQDALKASFAILSSMAKKGQLYFQQAGNPIWLQDMDYQLNYDDAQENIADNQRLLNSGDQSPFPTMAVKGDKIHLRRRQPLEYGGADTQSQPRTGSDEVLLTATIIDIHPMQGTLLIEREGDSKQSFPIPEDAWRYIWNFSESAYATLDRFSFVISIVHNRKIIENQGIDRDKLNEWLQQTILNEFPAHVSLISHWLNDSAFQNFALIYARWRKNGAVLDTDGYSILQALTLGHLPVDTLGVGNMRVASEAEHNEAVGEDGSEWHPDIIADKALFYV
ncbi:hypothetical protein [Erwinia oleae]|uniref:hypothetical protein n=1 Tax=Erwinia oleae TaxID=796334 RepID=UPI00126997F8|nr:hypothetical protein [Erwinia oleae]